MIFCLKVDIIIGKDLSLSPSAKHRLYPFHSLHMMLRYNCLTFTLLSGVR